MNVRTVKHCLIVVMFALVGNLLYAQPGGEDTDMSEFKIRNIGTVVNTGALEYAPTITADGKTLYFVSDRPGGVAGHDFWYTTKADRLDTVFTLPVNLGSPINTELNEGVASIAADGQTIYFTGCERTDGLGDCDIYEAELDGKEWINVRNLSEINSPYWDSQPSISSDGKTLYFVSNRPGALGGNGDADIYISTLRSDGRWSDPANAGPPINTEEREDSPFIFPGGKILFFSSAGHGGFGGLDFFTVKKNTDGTWGMPENLGEPFNTSRDERFLTLPAAGDVVYFASERNDMENEGLLDIFMGILPPKIVTVLIAGRVFDMCTNESLIADLTFIHVETGDTVQPTMKTNASTGEYSFVVNAEGAMTIRAIGNHRNYGDFGATIKVPETKEYLELRQDFPLGETPVLAANYEIADYIKNLPSTVPAKYRDFRGLLIEENLVKELYPLLTYVFFDSGSANIPSRYVLFKNPSQTQNFDDTKIPGGTLQKYYHMLNIVGYRMRKNPNTKIEIVGNNSQEPAIGETKETSKARGEIVYNYLIDIWQIDPSRIKLLPPRDFPEQRSNPRDPQGIVENRRTEIRSDDWEIVKPILITELRRYPQPETMFFTMQNKISDELVARRAIEIKRKGQMWHVLKDIGVTDPKTEDYDWTRNGSGDVVADIPNNEDPYIAQLVLYNKEGKECRSNEITIPVMLIDNERKRREVLVDKTIDRYSLVLFQFDSPKAGPLNERILKEYIYGDIREGAIIKVTGYTDVVGLDDRNMKLSEQRAETVRGGIARNVKSSIYASLEGKGVGETAPLYPNDLPEGRFYNRTVQVVIETPSKVTGSN